MKIVKILSAIIVVVLSVLLTSCSESNASLVGAEIPDIEMQNEFYNDDWLIIDSILVNKSENKVYKLRPDTEAVIEGFPYFFYHGPYTYKVEFDENEFRLYTFLRTYYYVDGESVAAFFDCEFTYDYEGNEIGRKYISEQLTEEQVLALYDSRFEQTDGFLFNIDAMWKYQKEDHKWTGKTEQDIIEHVEKIYNGSGNPLTHVFGRAKTIGEEIWFTYDEPEKVGFSAGNPLLNGEHKSGIKSYDSNTGEIIDVFKYNANNETVVDFDEGGLFTFSSRMELKYYNIETEESTLIHKFPGRVSSFDITDKYIGVHYLIGNIPYSETDYYYAIYEKGNGIVADNRYM